MASKTAPKKVLFLAMPLKGHLIYSARMAEWFLEYPLEYEIHIMSSPEVEHLFPKGVVFHPDPESPGPKEYEAIFAACSEGKSQIESLAIMLTSFDVAKKSASTKFTIEKIRGLRPDVVVYEHAHNFGNVMHTLCRQLKIPDVCLVAMGRPESAFDLARMLPESALEAVRGLFSLGKEFEEVLGCEMLPDTEKPVTIYPGAQAMCEVPPKPNEIFTGAFLPLPLEAPSMSPSRLDLGAQLSPEIETWVHEKCQSGIDIVYIALGTLATPSQQLLERIVEALDDGPWAIMWALPEAHQALLPKRLGEHWCVDKFLPQAELFEAKVVKCFISHCGANSTTEAICNGIPMVCMPFFGDQYEWASAVTSHMKAGVTIDKHMSSATDIAGAVREVVGDALFAQRAREVAAASAANARKRLEYLGAPLLNSNTMRRVGVLVAAAVIQKRLAGTSALEALPPAMRCGGA